MHIFYFIRNLVFPFFSFFSSFILLVEIQDTKTYRLRSWKKIKLPRCPKTKRSRYRFREKKENFRGFWVFDFALYPFCLFFKILTVAIAQDLKTTKIWTERKTERLQYELKEKEKFPLFPSFRFCSIPKIENSEISEILFTSNFDTGCNSRFKNAKEMNWDKN